MTIYKSTPLILLIVIAITQLTGCTTAATLPKSKALLATELFYETTSNELKGSQPVEAELSKASDMLESAVLAKTEKEMAAMVYISNNQIKTAIQAAEAEAAKERVREIRTLKLNMRNQFSQAEKE
jgi:hypothetical protein